MNLKPKLFVGVQKLTADEELRERKIKEKVLKLSLDDVSVYFFFFFFDLTEQVNQFL